MKKGFSNMAQRIANAEIGMIETIKTIAGLSDTEARRAFDTLRKVKAIKLDAVNGRYDVKHGAFMDREVLTRAAK
jgi:hypothetical protein